MSIAKKIAIGLAGLSYSYGFCRLWTLPIWNHPPKDPLGYSKEQWFRTSLSAVNGLTYVFPPWCLIHCLHLGIRLRERREGIQTYGLEHWKEFGFVHPRAL